MAFLENDGCSFFPDQWNGHSLNTCCAVHDLAFAQGATAAEFWNANVGLFRCVWAISPFLAILILIGVMSPPAVLIFILGRKQRKGDPL